MNTFHSLYSCDDSQYHWKVKVRVVRVWDSIHKRKDLKTNQIFYDFKGRNLILLDDKQQRVHAFIWESYKSLIEINFIEGDIYIIKNFQVKPYTDAALRPVRHNKQFYLSNHTNVRHLEHDDGMISQNEFDFYDFTEIPELLKLPSQTQLIDVIGVIEAMDSLCRIKNKNGEDQCYIRLTLTDGSESVKVWLWDKAAEQFEKDYEDAEKPVILILTSMKMNSFREAPTLSTMSASKCYVNLNHSSVHQLRESLSDSDFMKVKVLVAEQKETPPILALKDIQNLHESYINKPILCQVVIKSIEDEDQWFYRPCPGCGEEVELDGSKFRCEKCKKKVPYPEKRFRLCVIIEDSTDAVPVILMDREVRRIIGKQYYQVRVVCKETKKDLFPDILRSIIGNQYTITLSMSEENLKKKSSVYTAADIFPGFDLNVDIAEQEETYDSFDYRPSQISSTSDGTQSLTSIRLGTPDTVNSKAAKSSKNLGKRVMDLDATENIINLEYDDNTTPNPLHKKKSLKIEH